MKRNLLGLGLVLAALAACGSSKAPGSGAVSMLSAKDKQFVAKTLAGMKDEVRLVLFSRDGGECRYCGEAEGMLADIASADSRVKVEVLSLRNDSARAKELGIDHVPGIAILGKKDYGMRYLGLPSGYEFIPFVETIRSVGNADPELSKETLVALARLTKPVQLSVFVTQH